MSSYQQQASAQKVRRYRCPGCAADQVYEPKDGCLTCPYCGRREAIPTSPEQVQERSYEQYLQTSANQLAQIAQGALEVVCNGCASTVTFTPPEVAGECAFCGSKIVAQPKSANPMVAPEGLLPFKVSQNDATEAIKKWLATRWFAPNALKRLASQDSINGVYLPFWTYDTNTVSHYVGERGEHYYVTETYTETDSQGNHVTKTREVQHTRWYPTFGTVSRWFDDVLIAATKSLSRQHLDSLEPWDLAALQPYDPAFLSGFKAQRYQVELAEGFELAKNVMAETINNDVRRDIGGDEQRIFTISTSYSGITFKHIMLPVFVAAYRFNEKLYQVMVNARTAKVYGDRPYSVWKITLLVISILLAIIVLYALFHGHGH